MTEDEAYEALGLAPGAEPDRVDAAHRRLAARAHPDRWFDAAPAEQEGARARYEEVNEAHRVLKAARKAGLGGPTAPAAPPPRRRPTAPEPPPPPPPPRPAPPTGATTLPDVDEDPEHHVPGGLIAAAVGLVAVVGVLGAIGLATRTPDGSRQREVLGPLAHRVWEAERTGDWGTVWDLSEPALQAQATRASFIAHLSTCPRTYPPRDVARIAKVGGGVWEVDATDPEGSPVPSSYFRQQGDYGFAAIFDDSDLLAYLAAPVSSAPTQRWCGA